MKQTALIPQLVDGDSVAVKKWVQRGPTAKDHMKRLVLKTQNYFT